jgi:hypothetical protein
LLDAEKMRGEEARRAEWSSSFSPSYYSFFDMLCVCVVSIAVGRTCQADRLACLGARLVACEADLREPEAVDWISGLHPKYGPHAR